MTKLLKLSIAAVAVCTLATAVQAQPKDPVLGTWVLNLSKSTFSPGPAPKSSTRVYTQKGDKYHAVAETVGADGKVSKNEFTAAYDGKDYAYSGDPNADMIAITRVDARTISAVLKKGGKPTAVKSTRSVSEDGKTLTLTQTGTNAMGAAVKNVLVYDRK